MKNYFYASSIHTAIGAFAELFINMSTRVYDKEGNIIGVKPVPSTITPREKIVSILEAKNTVNDVDPQVDNYLPRISINMTGLNWAPERMKGKFERRILNIEYASEGQNHRQIQTDLQPVPYNLTFELTVWAKYLTDGLQIVENILPWFAPELHLAFKERNFGIEHKAKVTLQGINYQPTIDFSEGGDSGRRILQWTLTFEMESILWKPMELKNEIVCSIVSIANVPCKKTIFEGGKVISYDPITNTPESLFTKQTVVNLYALDDKDGYDLMADYWKMANNVMEGGDYQTCVTENCAQNQGPEPIWNPDLNVTPCIPPIQDPVLVINSTISLYWQEIVNDNGILDIISLVKVTDLQGNYISGPTLIPNDQYPPQSIPPTSGG